MSTILTNEEKSGIISQHVKNVEYSLYNLNLSLIQENAVSSPDADKISSLNDQIDDLNAQKAALESERLSLA
jgi:hypothetical protein